MADEQDNEWINVGLKSVGSGMSVFADQNAAALIAEGVAAAVVDIGPSATRCDTQMDKCRSEEKNYTQGQLPRPEGRSLSRASGES